ncbi:NADH-quinone oxidoreductase subunit H [Mycobacterium sp.]|uniref:respiratory chain complex I subunit 1 family protein n=1 Tax=Mycobacterium sp. TaxID=1785 RepID=UPI0025EA4C20|nr:NADH-quinone oxidoreductase subunit H [Mycobacterium sp.]
MTALPLPLIQALQVLTVAGGAPGVSGFIAWFEARLQGRRGPRIMQPYFDLTKLFGKESLTPNGAGPIFRLAPVVSFACYLTVPMLIPVLTDYPLPLGYMGDILGGGLILAFASFLVAVGAAETGDSYAQLASSRAKTFAAITEPVMLLVFFTVAMITTTDLPYALAATVRSGPDQIVRPAHLLASAALFMVILYETGRIPVETHTGTIELGMIESGRDFEYSGPDLALLHWGSAAKQLVLYVILLNVFVAPWGMAGSASPLEVGLAIPAILGKAALLGCVIAVIDNSYAKLRLFKITEFVSAALLLAILAVFTLYLGGADGACGEPVCAHRLRRSRELRGVDRAVAGVRHVASVAAAGADTSVRHAVAGGQCAGCRRGVPPSCLRVVWPGSAVVFAQSGRCAAAGVRAAAGGPR